MGAAHVVAGLRVAATEAAARHALAVLVARHPVAGFVLMRDVVLRERVALALDHRTAPGAVVSAMREALRA